MFNGLQGLPQVITAIGGLGTAAFGLVEAAKPIFGGINRIGLSHIHQLVADLTPETPGAGGPVNALPQAKILETLEANWVNGNDLTSQKAVAKSLIKLHLNAANAPAVAIKTSVDSTVLTAVATGQASGTPLTPAQSDVFARFDLIVTAMLDEAYQISDQVYRNWTRTLAAAVAVVLAFVGGWSLEGTAQFWHHSWHSSDVALSLLVGLLATPLAPIAKDLSTALATAVNTMQLVKK
ncbi:MAG: hypothetical protein ACLQVM_25940 [Terriglobia bacterium]